MVGPPPPARTIAAAMLAPKLLIRGGETMVYPAALDVGGSIRKAARASVVAAISVMSRRVRRVTGRVCVHPATVCAICACLVVRQTVERADPAVVRATALQDLVALHPGQPLAAWVSTVPPSAAAAARTVASMSMLPVVVACVVPSPRIQRAPAGSTIGGGPCAITTAVKRLRGRARALAIVCVRIPVVQRRFLVRSLVRATVAVAAFTVIAVAVAAAVAVRV